MLKLCLLGVFFWAAAAHAVVYFVNDLSTSGDVYTTAVGSDASSGLSNSAPKLTLTNLLATYTLVPGDVVYIDTGIYSNYTVTISSTGTLASPVLFQGSTNWAVGGTRFIRNNTGESVFEVLGSRNVLADIRAARGARGFFVTGAENQFLGAYAYSNNLHGFAFQNCRSNVVRHSVASWNVQAGVWQQGNSSFFNFIEHSVMWENRFGVLANGASGNGLLVISNSIISITGSASRAYSMNSGALIRGNFNGICRREGAVVMGEQTTGEGFTAYHLSDWQAAYTQELNSLCAPALFANPSALDFYQRSLVGRYVPAAGTFTNDADHSAFIDAGDPSAVFTNEPAPNGGRINVGAFGGTRFASMSRTSAWLQVATYNDGGTLVATGQLYWLHGAFPTGALVELHYSPDNGAEWLPIATNVAVTNTPFVWVATNAQSSLQTRWRVRSQTDPLVLSTNSLYFALRSSQTSAFSAYVNDASVTGDVYSTAVGSALNSGLSNSAPAASIQQLLDSFVFGPGDSIYVDTGTYTGSQSAVTITTADQGSVGRLFRIIGSTNAAAGGTQLVREGPLTDGISIAANDVELARLRIRNARYGVLFGAGQRNLMREVLVVNSINGFRGVSTSISNHFWGCVVVSNSIGLSSFGLNNFWTHGVMWSNGIAFDSGSANTYSVSNSVIAFGTAFSGAGGVPVRGEHNIFWGISTYGPSLNTLIDLQKAQSGWWRSTVANPLFANPAGLDFHPLSVEGRFDPVAGAYTTNDGTTSILVDFGDPFSTAFTNEPSPNGGRVNAGAHGGTAEASKSPTNARLVALTVNDGGIFSVGDSVYWNALNVPSGATVRIEYSGDAGVSWSSVVTNVDAMAGVYVWTDTNFPSSLSSRWRVVLESNPSVSSANSTNFNFRNGPYYYYINDDSTAGDIYTTAVGNDLNGGSTPATPKRTLTNLIATIDLEPGDVVYIDTGLYRNSGIPQIGVPDSGSTTNPVILQFSTNHAAGGSVLDRIAPGLASHGIHFLPGAAFIEVRNVVITNAFSGIRVDSATGIVIRGATIHGMRDSGVRLFAAVSSVVDRVAAYNNASNGIHLSNASDLRVSRSVLWGNRSAQARVENGWMSVTNSAFITMLPAAPIYRVSATTNVFANHNAYFAQSNSSMAEIASIPEGLDSLSAWQFWTGQDARSRDGDPLFADPAAGDFHLRTQTPAGRFDPATGLWVSDAETSPLIDVGDPASAFALEPEENGDRINIGLHGNTPFASRGRTQPWLQAASLREGGWVKGTTTLHWVSGNIASNSLVRIDFSPDGGQQWSVISTGTPVLAETYAWNTTATNNTPAGLWRVTSLAETNVSDQTTNFFAIRNGTLAIYLNDAALENDVYSSGPGAATNWIASAARPLNSLALAFRVYDLEPGDVVYVDAGVYLEGEPVDISRRDSGLTNNPVWVLGPTNGALARHDRQSTASGSIGLQLSDARGIVMSNLLFYGASVGVQVSASSDLTLGIHAANNASNGFFVVNTTNANLRRMASSGNAGRGLISATNSLLVLDHAVLWSNAAGAVQFRAGELHVSNSILHAFGAGRYVYEIQSTSDVLRADHNNVLVEGQAQVALRAGLALRFLSNIRQSLGLERFSLSHPPQFANPAQQDFSLKSDMGRYSPGGILVTDLVTSVLIDAGDPARAFALETEPNGARINIGLHGGTAFASRSRTNAWLLAVTQNDGGVMRGTNSIYWIAGGAATGHLVTLQFSGDGGANWTNIAENIPASSGIFTNWDTTLHESTLLGQWRVVSQVETNIFDATDALFTLNNGSLTYYVNDASTDDDVYTTAPGSSVNDGALPGSPAASIQQILDRYSLNPGDRILVDTGNYLLSSPVSIDGAVAGTLTNMIIIQGSTNEAAGGTLFDRQGGTTAMELVDGASQIMLRHLRFRNARQSVLMRGVTNCVLEWVDIREPARFATDVVGFELVRATGAVFRYCAVAGFTNATGAGAGLRASQSGTIVWQQGVMWSNVAAMELNLTHANVSNSIFAVFRAGSYAYVAGQASVVTGNYNNYFLREGAWLARETEYYEFPTVSAPRYYETLAEWTRQTGRDSRSLSHDPLFADAANGDFRLRSQGGRFLPGGGTTFDDATSPLIDAGPPSADFSLEPLPNGQRMNLGRYGNTAQASMSPTNARFTAIALNDGGLAIGTNVLLTWLAGGAATSHLVRVDISYDDAFAWIGLASNIPAAQGQVSWNTTAWLTQPFVRWRVQSQSNSNIVDVNDRWFQIHNSNRVYYVNDGNLTGDVHTTGVGYEFNSGLQPGLPKSSLKELLDAYDLEPGDTVYVDTGIYTQAVHLVIAQSDGGSVTNPVRIFGSTNVLQGGSRFIGAGMRFDGVRHMEVRDLALEITGPMRDVGLQTRSSSNLLISGVAINGSPGHGVEVRQSADVRIENSSIQGSVTNGLFDNGSIWTVWRSGVIWSNPVGVRSDSRKAQPLLVFNSVLGALDSNQIAFVASSNLISDYNAIFVTNGAQVGNEFVPGRQLPLLYFSVGQWSVSTERDRRSLAVEPRFANPGVDFHLRSTAGRYNPTTGLFDVDGVSSLLIDAGDPVEAYANEPDPNGQRLNIGRYGNTFQASKSPSNPVLLASSMRDGGIIGATQLLYWVARGDATGDFVRIDYSADGGLTWTNIATNLAASSGGYEWITTSFPSTVLGKWRVVSESNPAVADTNLVPFAVRNGPVLFYVNDAGLSGDVYTLAPGATTNLGISPISPLHSISAIIERYDLEPGDVVYVDTGVYSNSVSIAIGQNDSGTADGMGAVILQGSTNEAAGGTRIVALTVQPAFDFFDARHLSLRDMRVEAASGPGIRIRKSEQISLHRMHVRGGTIAFEIQESTAISGLRSIAQDYAASGISANLSTGLRWDSGVFWSSGTSAVNLVNSSLAVSNSILSGWGENRFLYRYDFNSSILSEYNGFWMTNGAMLAQRTLQAPLVYPMVWETLSRWARDTGNDRFSLFGDPRFHDPTNGAFYLRSEAGRYDPALSGYTNDVETSPFIDAGAPFLSAAAESTPNGGRINLGPHGGTARSSRTPTNATLLTVSLNDGGRAEGSAWPLYWLARGDATGHTVRIEYSINTGATWSVIQTALPARVSAPAFWNTTSVLSSALGLWRVVSEVDPDVSATNHMRFALRNQALSFYVNDGGTEGDMYTTVAGSAIFSGVTPDAPRASLQSILDDYDLEPGDSVYLDTGIYAISGSPIRWTRYDAWNTMSNLAPLTAGGTSVALRGSTNLLAGGSVLLGIDVPIVMSVTQSLALSVSDVTIRHQFPTDRLGLEINDSPYLRLQRVRVLNGKDGIQINRSSNIRMSNSLVRSQSNVGVGTLQSTDVRWNNGVVWSNKVGFFQNDSDTGTLLVENTAIGSVFTGAFAFVRVKGTLQSDYNNIFRTNGGFAAGLVQSGVLGGGTTRYETVTAWYNASGSDGRSLSSNPRFAGPDDYHLQSPVGRFVPGTGYVSGVDAEFSPMIDAGRPSSPFTLEPEPNGDRVNIGLFGNSAEASLSSSNGKLTTITFNDGGSGDGTIELRWNASGSATGELVTIQFSSNGGATWTNIAANVPGSAGTYLWNSVPFGRAAAGLWRVYSQSDTNVLDVTDAFFALRNPIDGSPFASIPYYVNDAFTEGDVYCTVPGNDEFSGFLPSTPKASLQALLDAVDLEPGDIVYVDTGTYNLSATVRIGDLDAGLPTNRVVIQGSTNALAGGTVFNRQTGSGTAIELFETVGIELRDFRIVNAGIGVALRKADYCVLERITSELHTQTAFLSDEAGTNFFRYCVAASSSNGLVTSKGWMDWRQGTIWAAQNPVVLDTAGSLIMQNSFVPAAGPTRRIFRVSEQGGSVLADYNAYRRTEGALMYERTRAVGGNEVFARLWDWQRSTGQDLRSLTHDPAMVNPTGGDYQLRSDTGRYLQNGSYTNDPGVFSPLIDTGNPSAIWTNEPSPNGQRANIGNLGNSPMASMSPTNPWLLALSFNDGGTIGGTVAVYWAAGAMPTGALVRLEQALDGVDFTTFASNLPAQAGSHPWDVSALPPTSLARWRVVCENCTASDMNDSPISIKNGVLVIYVNDQDTTGDIYTTIPGSPTNTGLSAGSPLHDPDWAVQKFPIGPDDIIYIDTGVYALTNPAGIALGLVGANLSQGESNFPIRIQGSTNRLAGGTLLVGAPGTNSYGLTLLETKYVDLDHIRITGARSGLYIERAIDINLSNVETFGHSGHGLHVVRSAPVRSMHVAAWSNQLFGAAVESDAELDFINSIAWGNQSGGFSLIQNGRLNARNSILHAGVTNTFIVRSSGTPLGNFGDYNILWRTNGAQLARDVQRGLTMRSLSAIQFLTAGNFNSAVLDPSLNNPAGGDFTLRSEAGRFDFVMESFVGDADTSWAIDAGDPLADFARESAPNGGRLNVGWFGNTEWASRSITGFANRAIRIISYDDGGQMSQPGELRWYARGYSSTDLVELAFSPNNGLDWMMIASNVQAVSGAYFWSPEPTNSTPEALWRVTDQLDASRSGTNQVPFALRLEPITFYVNDASTAGDLYTSAIGSPTNNALTPTSPMDSISGVLERYDLEARDQILVDTGYYVLTNAISIRLDDSGTNHAPISIVGSTNTVGGGTVLDRASSNLGSLTLNDEAFDLLGAEHIHISHLTIQNANVGLFVDKTRGLVVSNVVIQQGGRAGIEFKEGSSNSLRRVLVRDMIGSGIGVDGTVYMDSSVIWSNGGSAVIVNSGSLLMSNTVLHATGTNIAYRVGALGEIKANYNNVHLVSGARVAQKESLVFDELLQWTVFSDQDRHSLSVDPLFYDPAGGDFHPLSPAGRYLPSSNEFVQSDALYSYLVDTGATNHPFSAEPAPNGGRRNIGLHGNTAEASMGRTNAWLLALTGNSGGRVGGTFWLAWAWGMMEPTNGVNLEFSYDAGTNWVTIATNRAVSSGEYLWNSADESLAVSPIARWRIYLTSDTNVLDRTDSTFALNGPFGFYVNDNDTACDMFTTAPGSTNNLGIFPNQPMASLRQALDTWDLEGGDTVYVDTGYYASGSNDLIVIGASDAGKPGDLVRIIGSTNCLGARIVWTDATPAAFIAEIEGSNFDISGLSFERAGVRFSGTNAQFRHLAFSNTVAELGGADVVVSNLNMIGGVVRTTGRNHNLARVTVRGGLLELNGSDITLRNSLAYGTQTVSAVIGGTNIVLNNNTFVSQRTALVLDGGDASLTLRNNTIVADGTASEAFIILRLRGALNSDYNNLVARSGAWFGNADGNWEKLLYWQRASGQDLNSISTDPLFADESGFDFHPRSTGGRWTPSGFETDVVHAMTIDLGNPSSPFSMETAPNGSRINIGAYGNTEQAGRSRLGPWLFAMTLNDGGVVKSNQVIRWASGNLPDGATVSITYSPDNGSTWTTVAAGVTAAMGQYNWDTTLVPSSLNALWAVVLDDDTNVVDVVDTTFAVRNVPLSFFVNDSSTSGVVYTTIAGNPTNNGLTPATPMRWISDVLSRYDTEAGDVIYVDTGVYNLTQNVVVIWSRGGDPTNGPLWIWGSTNFAAGGSVLSRGSFAAGAAALDIKASHVRVRNLTIRESLNGVLLDSNRNVVVERMNIVSNRVGVHASRATEPVIRNNTFRHNTTSAVFLVNSSSNIVENNTFHDNVPVAILLSASLPNVLQNNIFSLGVTGITAYAGVLDQTFVDYNVYYFRTSAVAIAGAQNNMLQWQLTTARDYRSVVTNPAFANLDAGDFHIRSTLGRWVDGYGFTNDLIDSWAIDRGATNSVYVQEPEPNGARINIGAYGNTEYASKGLASTQSLVETRILNETTLINETNSTWPLIWSTINVPTAELFRVEFSGDGGSTWYILSNNVPAYQEFIVWQASPFFNTYKGLWRVVGVDNTNFWDVNDAQFQLFFGTFRVSQVFADINTNGIVFRGAWAEHYQVQWATNVTGNDYVWWNAVNGAGPLEKASFLSTNGGDFIYRDVESTNQKFRLYRVLRQDMEP
ncbi:MAG TPA: right-handed parallel beta-helix repeat-containing protein [Kiritimatiellia bacterium]|nr:right-handed parallel beta-helix repeat-containing protein [Kiritimatiellia bacterium]